MLGVARDLGVLVNGGAAFGLERPLLAYRRAPRELASLFLRRDP
jgi:hypothetical protein